MKKDGKKVEIGKVEKRESEVSHDRNRERALAKLRSLRRSFPPDFRFDRNEGNAR
jgi:antitoxin MazE